jgi:enterochelin esterase family protein
MKANSQITLIVYVIIFILAFGCKDSQSPTFISSSTPTKAQLKKSNFVKTISELINLPEYQRKNYLQGFLINYPNSPIIEDSSIAVFYWFGKATSVLINGDAQAGWTKPDTMESITCGEEKFYYKIYSLPADARIDYQFIVDGKIITDPRNSIITPSGFGDHSQCAMPMFKSDSVLLYRAEIFHGTVDSLFFASKQTSILPRSLKIYKPAKFDSLTSLPSLYVNDGFKAIDFCSYINVLDNLIADNKINPVLVVFVDFVEGDQDYFLNKTEEYFTAVCNELVPFIDTKYNTSKQAKDRVLAGISAGAHISLLTALKKSDVFLNAAGQSPTTTEALFDAVNSASINKQTKKELKLYFDVGRFDLVQSGIDNHSFLYANQLLRKEMKNSGINHIFNVFNDGHQWANWRERIDEILIYFFGI